MKRMKIKNTSALRKKVVIIAVICILCSSAYLIYDLVWTPAHFKKLNKEISIAEAEKGDCGDSDILEKYSFIKNRYSDYAGRLVIEGLDVDFPVAQCGNNNYYLRHTLDGKTDKHGTLFADCRNNLKELDDNNVIYGHNMKDCTQFGMLNAYKTVEGYKNSPIVSFNTLYSDYKWKIFAAFLINTNPKDDDGYAFDYIRTDFKSENEFNEFYNEVMERSYFITDTDVSYEDKILTMSTCSTLFDDSRLVVMARLLRDGEDEFVDTSSAHANEKQRFPSAFKTSN